MGFLNERARACVCARVISLANQRLSLLCEVNRRVCSRIHLILKPIIPIWLIYRRRTRARARTHTLHEGYKRAQTLPDPTCVSTTHTHTHTLMQRSAEGPRVHSKHRFTPPDPDVNSCFTRYLIKKRAHARAHAQSGGHLDVNAKISSGGFFLGGRKPQPPLRFQISHRHLEKTNKHNRACLSWLLLLFIAFLFPAESPPNRHVCTHASVLTL